MVDVYLAVRPGVGDAGAVARAVLRHRPDARLYAVWGGDPHLRPPPVVTDGWADLGVPEPSGLGWERLRLLAGSRRTGLAKACAAAARVDTDWLVLSVGDVVVTGDVARLVPPHGWSPIARSLPPVVDDGLGPTRDEVLARGQWSAAALAGTGGSTAELLAERLVLGAARVDADRIVEPETAADDADASQACAIGLDPVRAEDGVILDTTLIERGDPWYVLSRSPARHPLSATPELLAVLRSEADQWAGVDRPLHLPGALPVDDAIVDCLAAAVDDWRRSGAELPPEPYSQPAAFRRWLESPTAMWEPDAGRYWWAAFLRRPDLMARVGRPEGVDFDEYVTWAERRWWVESESMLLRTGRGSMRPPWVDGGCRPGINLVGYHGFDKSLGDVVRRVAGSLAAADEPFVALDYLRSGSPRSAVAAEVGRSVEHDVNVCVVNADSIANLMADYGDVLAPGRRTIGYWFWELEEVPERLFEAFEHVDEIWVATEFVADAFRRVTEMPVRVVPIPVPEPVPGPETRADLGLPEDRFVFLTTYDYLSVAERKNPVGAIEAFRAAFPGPLEGGPVLVVKSLNADHRWVAHERTLLAASGRPDIIVRDEHLTRSAQMSMVRAADCLVSLHRSEGLGLHLMEAMWLGTPTIATRYSGNVDFMTDDNSLLVDAALTDVVRGEGAFQTGARWADPDLGAAAGAMRRIVSEADLRRHLIEQGRRTMESQPTFIETGRTIAALVSDLRQGAPT